MYGAELRYQHLQPLKHRKKQTVRLIIKTYKTTKKSTKIICFSILASKFNSKLQLLAERIEREIYI